MLHNYVLKWKNAMVCDACYLSQRDANQRTSWSERNQQLYSDALWNPFKEWTQETWVGSVIRDIVFVHTTQSELQRIKYGIPYFQYMMDIRNGEKIIVPDEQMRRFIAVAGTYDEQIIFFSPERLT